MSVKLINNKTGNPVTYKGRVAVYKDTAEALDTLKANSADPAGFSVVDTATGEQSSATPSAAGANLADLQSGGAVARESASEMPRALADIQPYSSAYYSATPEDQRTAGGEIKAAAQDVFSLPGRAAATTLGGMYSLGKGFLTGSKEKYDPLQELGRTHEDVDTSPLGSIVRDPVTGALMLATAGTSALAELPAAAGLAEAYGASSKPVQALTQAAALGSESGIAGETLGGQDENVGADVLGGLVGSGVGSAANALANRTIAGSLASKYGMSLSEAQKTLSEFGGYTPAATHEAAYNRYNEATRGRSGRGDAILRFTNARTPATEYNAPGVQSIDINSMADQLREMVVANRQGRVGEDRAKAVSMVAKVRDALNDMAARTEGGIRPGDVTAMVDRYSTGLPEFRDAYNRVVSDAQDALLMSRDDIRQYFGGKLAAAREATATTPKIFQTPYVYPPGKDPSLLGGTKKLLSQYAVPTASYLSGGLQGEQSAVGRSLAAPFGSELYKVLGLPDITEAPQP